MFSALPVRTRFRLVVYTVMLIGFAVGVLAVQLQSWALIIVLFAWVAVGSLLIHRVRCPKCGTPVGYQGKFLGVRLYGALFAPKKCNACGYDFTKGSQL